MFPSLTNAIEGCKATLNEGQFHIIADTPYLSANSFVIYYLVSAIKERKVCFIALQNSWSHYLNICNKLGVNLRSKCTDGSVEVIDAMKMIPMIFNDDENENNSNGFSFIVKNKDQPLKDLFNEIKRIVHKLRVTGNSVAIIIDNISLLLNLGLRVEDIDIFTQYCSNLLIFSKDIMVLSCSTDENDVKSNCLLNRLRHKASVCLSVASLSTGHSKNIHGELTVSRTPCNYDHKGVKNVSSFHYKVEEKDIKVFSAGLALKIL